MLTSCLKSSADAGAVNIKGTHNANKTERFISIPSLSGAQLHRDAHRNGRCVAIRWYDGQPLNEGVAKHSVSVSLTLT